MEKSLLPTTAKSPKAESLLFPNREDAAYWAATEVARGSWELADEALDWALSPPEQPFLATTANGVTVSVCRAPGGYQGAIGTRPRWMANLLAK